MLLEPRLRLEYIVLRAIIGLVRLMPLDTAVAISAKLWRVLAPYGKRHRRALANLALAYPEKTEAERRAIALAMWENLGRVMAETMQLDRLLADPAGSKLRLANCWIVMATSSARRSGCRCTPATGSCRSIRSPITAAKPAAVYRKVKNPYVDQYLRDQRRALYPGGLLAKGRDEHGCNAEAQKTAREIMDYVRRGGRLGIVCDLYDKMGMEVPFFGHPAPSTPIPAMIARRFGTRIWMSRCVRVDNACRFRIEVKELRVPRTANQSEDMKVIMHGLHAQFEAWVREYPEQWMWSNRRWS